VRTLQDNRCSYYGQNNNLKQCTLGLQGSHQIANASLALAACELLEQSDAIKINASQIRSGLEHTQWPGRLEVASHRPHIILDGAHNRQAARALADYLGSHFNKDRITMVVGILDDKPHYQILKMLAEVSSRVIVTRPTIDRALPAEALKKDASQWWPDVLLEPTVPSALRKAVELNDDDQVICVAGSLYVVGEAKTALSNMKFIQ
jgi:dihydrofolate synthase/folylpolyglutamate synthase